MANPPFRDADALVTLRSFRNDHGGVSGADLLDYQKEQRLFESAALAGYASYSWTGQSLPGFEGVEVLRGLQVTEDYFRVLDHPMRKRYATIA
jgi:hypothetical protein